MATLKANNNGIFISTKQQDVNNLRDFNCNIKLNDIAWQDKQVSEFRKFFKEKPYSRINGNNKKNEEHNVESLLLSEFSKRKSKDVYKRQEFEGNEITPTPMDKNEQSYAATIIIRK